MKRPSLFRVLAILAATSSFLTVLFLCGPRPIVDETVPALVLPKDLDAYLRESEAAVSGIRPNTEKCIVWADPSKKTRTPWAVVYIHGFSATRQEVHPLSDYLAKDLGANSFYTRLKGHGRDGEAMAEPQVNHWLRDACEASAIGKRLGERVIIVATSTGATLATWLATRADQQHLAGFIFLSPNFAPRDSRAGYLTYPWGAQLTRTLLGSHRGFKPFNEAQAKYWTTHYRTDALVTMMALVDLMHRSPLERIRTPTLVIYSPKDRVINVSLIEPTMKRFGSSIKQIEPYVDSESPSQHVLAGDVLAPKTTRPMANLMTKFVKGLEK